MKSNIRCTPHAQQTTLPLIIGIFARATRHKAIRPPQDLHLRDWLRHISTILTEKNNYGPAVRDPIGSMHGIFTYIYRKNQLNVGKSMIFFQPMHIYSEMCLGIGILTVKLFLYGRLGQAFAKFQSVGITWNLKIPPLEKEKHLYTTPQMFGFHVNFGRCL